MSVSIEVRFGKSSSSNYNKALTISRKFKNYSLVKDGNEYNSVVSNSEEIIRYSREFEKLWDIVGKWRSSELLVNNEPIAYDEIREIFEVLNCSKKYDKAIVQEDYCYKYDWSDDKILWGCRFLVAVASTVPSDYYHYGRRGEKYWYKFGKFSSKNVWAVDKAKIKQILLREADVKNLSLCKHFSKKKIDNGLNELPKSINPDKEENWEYETEDKVNGDTIAKIRTGVRPQLKGSRYTYGLELGIDASDTESNETDELDSTEGRFVPDVKYKDIGGIDSIIDVIREVIELPLKKPELLSHLGIRPHKGILLYGPPGCGKTMIAKAIANEVDAHFISIKGPELINKYWGQSEENLRNIFDEASSYQPSIIYFDEIDSIGQSRSSEETVRHYSSFLNQLLTLLDGIEDYGKVAVIGSTNRLELLDEALVRPGRFDHTIKIEKPTIDGCREIFKISTRNMPIDKKMDTIAFSKKLIGLSGAEIAFVVREGAYNCLRRNVDLNKIITNSDIEIPMADLIIEESDFETALRTINEQRH